LAAAPLKNGNLFCVDSVGAAKEMSFDDGGIATGNLYCY
jgi:hypothetical protein